VEPLPHIDALLDGVGTDNGSALDESLPAVADELREKTELLIPRFREAMDDDFNTAQALGVLFETVRATNRFLTECGSKTPATLALISRVRRCFSEVGGVLGLFGSQASAWLGGIKSAKTSQLEMSSAEIEQLIAERAAARKSKDFKRSDEIRDLLLQKGVQLLDSPQGTTWNIK